LQTALSLDGPQCRPHLALRPLANNLSSEYEMVAVSLNPGLGLLQEEDATVHTRIHARPIPVLGFQQDRDVFAGDIDNLEGHSQHLSRTLRVGRLKVRDSHSPVAISEREPCAEVQGSHVNALVLHNSDGQNAIKAS
jgi:hypothetical protein